MARLFAEVPTAGLVLPLTIGAATLAAADPSHLTSVAPFRGREGEVAGRLGLALPAPNGTAAWGEGRILWHGSGRWLLAGAPAPEGLGDLAAVVDQSDGVACVVLSGPAARDVLARLVPLDLREGAFAVGATARTLLNHLTVTLTRTGANAWEVMAMRSMAGTLVHELEAAMRGVAARG